MAILMSHLKIRGIILTILALLIFFGTQSSYAGWFDRIVPQGETHTVTAIDRDVAFLIDGYIYDARKFCYMAVGDRVVFFEGRHGVDYYATLYNLDGKERCEVLLQGRYYGE